MCLGLNVRTFGRRMRQCSSDVTFCDGASLLYS